MAAEPTELIDILVTPEAIIVPKSEPTSPMEDECFMEENIIGVGESTGTDNGTDTGEETSAQDLLQKVQFLEEQVAACLNNQPLLYQVFNKCNVLEQRLKTWKKEIDDRLTDLTSKSCSSTQQQQATACGLDPKPATLNSSKVVSKIDLSTSAVDDIGIDQDFEWAADPLDDDCLEDVSVNPSDQQSRITYGISFKCILCKITYKDAESLANHYTNQHSVPDLNDSTCVPRNTSSTKEVDLDLVVKKEGDDEVASFICGQCGEQFPDRWILNRHQHSKHEPPRFKREFCKQTFHRKGNARSHQKRVHGRISDGLIIVPKPEKSQPPPPPTNTNKPKEAPSKSAEGLIRGRKKSGRGRKVCPTCSKAVRDSEMKWHLLRHAGHKEHYCEVCGAGFLRPRELRRHSVKHSGQRPFTCPHCDKSFLHHHVLKRHMYIHTGKPYVCETCGAGFVTPYTLKLHLKGQKCSGRNASQAATTVPVVADPETEETETVEVEVQVENLFAELGT